MVYLFRGWLLLSAAVHSGAVLTVGLSLYSIHSVSKDFVFRCVYGSLPDWVLTSVNIVHKLLQIRWNRMSLQLLDLHELNCNVEAVCTG